MNSETMANPGPYPLKVYVASSFRNVHAVRLLHAAIRDAAPSVTILDWTAHATPPEGLSPQKRRQWFDTEQQGGQVFKFCMNACMDADLVIYLGDSGQDAGVEVGMAYASCVPVLGIRGPLEAPGLMLHGAVNLWVTDVQKALKIISKIVVCDDVRSNICEEYCPHRDVCKRPRMDTLFSHILGVVQS